MKLPEVDRRGVLVGGGILAALVVAFEAWPRRARSPLRAAGTDEAVFGAYLRIASDGRVTVALPQAETGQGAWTGLAQIAADELGADWMLVGVEPAPLSPLYDNPVAKAEWGVAARLTAGSASIRAYERPLRRAAATARALLVQAAAARWKIAPSAFDAVGGKVVCGARALGFGELVAEAAALGAPAAAPLRAAGHGGIAGNTLARLDGPAKASGGWRFTSDVRLPEMLFASLRLAPPGGRLTGFDRAAASKTGVRLVERAGWLAAIGPSWWVADRALQLATPTFTGRVNADTPAIEAALHAALDSGRLESVAEASDYAVAVAGKRPLAATYMIAPANHLALETPAAVARFDGGRLEVWAPGVAPDAVRDVAARAGGIDGASVTVYPMPSGDPNGGAFDVRAVGMAVELARIARRPVALTFPAATAHNHDLPRPPLLARMSALGDPAGGLASWHAIFAGTPGLGGVLARAGGDQTPRFAPRGAVPPYAVPALRIEAATAKLPIACGYFRGDVESLASFVTESFIDEVARARGIEPLAFRIGMLGGKPRLAGALMAAANKGGWDGGARGSAMGIAGASAYGSHIGLLAEASIGGDQRVKVTRLVAAVDCGRMINPALVRQQVEAALLSALTSAIGPAAEVIAGVTRARPLAALGLGRLADVPRVQVELIRSRANPGGVSGLASHVLAAAVGNAIYAATGQRLRRLPFDPMTPA